MHDQENGDDVAYPEPVGTSSKGLRAVAFHLASDGIPHAEDEHATVSGKIARRPITRSTGA